MSNKIKLSLAAVGIMTALSAQAGISVVNGEKGDFSIGGDVEFDVNYQNRDSQDNKFELNQTGRIRLDFMGERRTDTGHFLAIKVQPAAKNSGLLALDDAYFDFGKKEAWQMRIGRFEAANMFPLGQDTFVEYSGDTANDLYSDGYAYVYQMKEARGRGGDGQVMYTATMNNFTLELGAMLGDRSNLFNAKDGSGKKYHGEEVEKNKDSFIARPVLTYKEGGLQISAAIEKNLVKDAVVTKNGAVDVSDRTGYGVTATYETDNWRLIGNMAYMNAVDETNRTYGVNGLWNGFALGYIRAHNTYDNDKITGFYDGDVKVNTWYGSYQFADILGVPDFSIYLGAYHSSVDRDNETVTALFKEKTDTGFRARFKYLF